MTLAAVNEQEAPQARLPNLFLSTSTGPSKLASPSLLLQHGAQLQVCSILHGIVHDFREAHGNRAVTTADLLRKYPIESAPEEEASAIRELSSPQVYGDLRHGGRMQSPYPRLTPEDLQKCCDELRAALVWRALQPSMR